MKNRTKIILVVIGLLTIGAVWFICEAQEIPKGDNSNAKQSEKEMTDSLSVVSANTKIISADNDTAILVLTKQILTMLKNKKYKMLSEFIHPTLGLRFSPYAYIDTTTNLKFTAVNFFEKSKLQTILKWGNYDGSGDEILLTIEKYLEKFVYSADFLNADKTSLNKMIGTGNSLNNLETIYKNCNYTESYFAGFDEKYDGMDWCCLRLVYKKYQSKNYLIAIVHDQWTI